MTFISESQTEINVAEQDLRKAKDTRQDIERKLRVIEEERSSLEKVIEVEILGNRKLTGLQISGRNEKLFFLFLNQNIWSLEKT